MFYIYFNNRCRLVKEGQVSLTGAAGIELGSSALYVIVLSIALCPPDYQSVMIVCIHVQKLGNMNQSIIVD